MDHHAHGRSLGETARGANAISATSVPQARSLGMRGGISSMRSRHGPGLASGLSNKRAIALPSSQLAEPSLVMPLNV